MLSKKELLVNLIYKLKSEQKMPTFTKIREYAK